MKDLLNDLLIILFIIALLGIPVTAFAFSQWWFGANFVVFYICMGIIEVIAQSNSSKTVSQHIWDLAILKRWLVIVSLIIGWGALILHFFKILR